MLLEWLGRFCRNAFHDKYPSAINNDKILYTKKELLETAEQIEKLPCSRCDLYKKMRNSGRYLSEKKIFDRHYHLYCGARFLYCRVLILRKLWEKIRSTIPL